MQSYEGVFISILTTTFYVFLAWIPAAWLGSHAALRKTSRGLKLTAFVSLFLLLAITGLNSWRLWVMKPIFQRGWDMLPSNLAAGFIFLLLPVVLFMSWSLPVLWTALWTSTLQEAEVNADMRSRLVAPKFAVPFQLGLIGAFLGLFLVLLRPSSSFELVCVFGWLGYGTWRWYRQNRLLHAVEEKGFAAIPTFGPRMMRRSGIVLGFIAVLGAVGGVAWWKSWVPREYSMNMSHDAHMQMAHGATMRNVADFRGPKEGLPDRRFTLVAQKLMVKLGTGETIEAWTYNGQTPGPELRVRQGELVEVTLQNRDIPDGVTIHWHGVNVPNAEDGVAGLTQDAVMPEESHVYRFRAKDSGTYWYHSHQQSLKEVTKGLFGAFIVEPADAPASNSADLVALLHSWQVSDEPLRFVAAFGTVAAVRRAIPAGTPVRLRLINAGTDPQVLNLTGTSFRVTAIDGVDIHEPGTLDRSRMVLAAGGRYDLQFTMPAQAVRLSAVSDASTGGSPLPDSAKAHLLIAPDEKSDIADAPSLSEFDPAHYGTAVSGNVNLQSHFDHEYRFIFEAGLGFLARAPSFVYLINGETFPDTPSIVVREGDLIKVTFINRWFEPHPIHPHGHRMLVLRRNGQVVDGSPWWTDTLNVEPGETIEVALKADNPGIWMDHCHNLFHASYGMVMHLMYENVATDLVAGPATRNQPE